MKAKLIALAVLLLLAGTAGASEMQILVSRTLEGDLKLSGAQSETGVLEANADYHNTGGVSYTARMRMDVVSDEGLVFTGWSRKYTLAPGDRKSFMAHWYSPDAEGNHSAVLRIYYANEISEPLVMNFTTNPKDTEDVFTVYNLRTYGDYVRFSLAANRSADDVVVFPSEYPPGWIFEQAAMEGIPAGKSAEVILPYQADIFSDQDVTIAVATKDGSFYKEASLKLERIEGIPAYFSQLLDRIENALRF